MSVSVEFFGIPRQRAGRAIVELDTDQGSTCLGDVLLQLAQMFPALAKECFEGQRLQPGYVASLGGRQFVSAPETVLEPGESLLIMSNDSGG